MSNPIKTSQNWLNLDLANALQNASLNAVVVGAILAGILSIFFAMSIQSWDRPPIPASKGSVFFPPVSYWFGELSRIAANCHAFRSLKG